MCLRVSDFSTQVCPASQLHQVTALSRVHRAQPLQAPGPPVPGGDEGKRRPVEGVPGDQHQPGDQGQGDDEQ